jgi:predicted nucleotidyltransferase
MIQLIKNNLDQIRDVCKLHHVRSLYLIGSAARNEAQYHSDSDVDFLYRFKKEEISEMEYADNYFNLLSELQNILKRNVDLVAEEKLINPYFIERINKDKLKVYRS